MTTPRITQYLDHIALDDIVAVLAKSEGEDSREPVVCRALSDDNRNCPTLLGQSSFWRCTWWRLVLILRSRVRGVFSLRGSCARICTLFPIFIERLPTCVDRSQVLLACRI